MLYSDAVPAEVLLRQPVEQQLVVGVRVEAAGAVDELGHQLLGLGALPSVGIFCPNGFCVAQLA